MDGLDFVNTNWNKIVDATTVTFVDGDYIDVCLFI